MAESLLHVLGDRGGLASFGMGEAAFVTRLKRWFQLSQAPYASLSEAQAMSLGEAAVGVAERSLGREGDDIRRVLGQRWRSGLGLAHALAGPGAAEASPTRYVDPTFLLDRPLLDDLQKYAVTYLTDQLSAGGDSANLLCVVGEPYSGKKSVLANLIRRYVKSSPDHLPVFALQCAALTYAEVGERVAAFLEEGDASRGESEALPLDERLKRLRRRAESLAAIYILADLEVLPPSRDENAARRLIRQEDDVVELIDILLRGNPRTRVVISCEDPAPRAPGIEIWKRLGQGRPDCTLVRLDVPRVDALLRAVGGATGTDALTGLRAFQEEQADGVALHLCAALLRRHHATGTLGEGVAAVGGLLASARAAKEGGLRPGPVVAKLWEVLSDLEKVLCVVVAASDDGMRESSIAWVLRDLVPAAGSDEREEALEGLHRAFGGVLRREEPDRPYQPWALDDLPGERIDEPIYEFDRPTRVAILRAVEDGRWPDENGGKDQGKVWGSGLPRRVHRLIAAKAREKAHRRRLNVPGVYGARLRDLSRDVQAVLSLVASADLNDAAPAGGLAPLEVERAVLEGRAGGRATLRFAYLQMWREDIDRDHRCATQHAADELRLHVLLAVATSAGRSFFPPRPYVLDAGRLDALRRARVFTDGELLELPTSLAIAGHQTGAFQITRVAAAYANGLDLTKPGHVVLKKKTQRALIDTMLLDSNPKLGEIEDHVLQLIREVAGDGPGEVEARLKLQLRLGEICHLRGDARRASEAFEEAVRLERVLSGGEICPPGRSLISGHGARRFLRATLNWAVAEIRKEGGDLDAARRLIGRAKDPHAVSLRRLSRHAADRAGVLLDEARLHHVEGLVQEREGERDEVVRTSYGRAKALVEAAQAFVIEPGLPFAARLDLDGLVARIGVQLFAVHEGDKDELLRGCHDAAQRLRRIADDFDLAIYKAYARLLMAQIRKAQDGDRVRGDSKLVEDLKQAREIAESSDLGLYLQEITECQGWYGPPMASGSDWPEPPAKSLVRLRRVS
jgi:hypothetical protein